jgi:hypothetical protein
MVTHVIHAYIELIFSKIVMAELGNLKSLIGVLWIF